ncbi:MAG: MaoC/PaaZ C-terminal domain-containing protein [Fidelibacterota bacterium]|jgi:acyl dehydratase|tara:strand:+ start:3529 stop:3945 length:417 start_codon:yes stop_codon:yes gene_type:complete
MKINNYQIGDEIPSLNINPISRSMLALYAEASGDHNPIHIDIDFAKKSGLSDVIAHGMLVMSFLAQAITNIFPQESIKKFDSKFISMTNINDILTCEGKVIDIELKDSIKKLFLNLVVLDELGVKKLSGSAIIELIES